MKDLNLARLIPIAAATIFTIPSCGGQATTSGEGDGDSSGDGDGDGDGSTSEVVFAAQLESSLEDLCSGLRRCDPESFNYDYESVADCAEYVSENFESYYDLDDATCRRSLLEALDCLSDNFECDYSGWYECYESFEALYDACSVYDYYDYYDGYPDPGPPPPNE